MNVNLIASHYMLFFVILNLIVIQCISVFENPSFVLNIVYFFSHVNNTPSDKITFFTELQNSTIEERVTVLEFQVDSINNDINTINDEIIATNNDLTTLNNDVETLETEVRDLDEDLESQITVISAEQVLQDERLFTLEENEEGTYLSRHICHGILLQ